MLCRGLLTVATAVATGALLAGCSEPVPVPSPDLPPGDEERCRSLLDALPGTLADEDAAETEPADALGAAYGDPPIIVTCAPEPPPAFTAGSDCTEVNGVGWFVPDDQVADEGTDAVLSAVSYRPVLTVALPAEYRPEGAAAVLAELSAPIQEHLTPFEDCL